ncbi:MAG: SRPBCC family protein [Thermoanaerobaculia bacterium]
MKKILAGLAVAVTLTGIASAEVVETSASSLRVKHVLTVSATPEKAWQSFVNVGGWWGSDHTFSGNSANLKLDPHYGGCWCETLPNGGGVQHMTVVFVSAPQRMTLSGALGPLQTAGVAGAMTFQFVAKGAETEMTLTYNVGGYYPGGLASVAPSVDQVLGSQFARLQRLINTGSAEEKAAK